MRHKLNGPIDPYLGGMNTDGPPDPPEHDEEPPLVRHQGSLVPDAQIALDALEENRRLREAIEDYLLWEPGRAGHAAAHERLRLALDEERSA